VVVDGVVVVVDGVVVVVDGVVVVVDGVVVVVEGVVVDGVVVVGDLGTHLLHLKSDSVGPNSDPANATEVAGSLSVSFEDEAPPQPTTRIGTASINVPTDRDQWVKKFMEKRSIARCGRGDRDVRCATSDVLLRRMSCCRQFLAAMKPCL
jgi:hypothetical protein